MAVSVEEPHLPIIPSLPVRPDDLLEFRLGRLLLLLDVARQQSGLKPLDIERLGYYDFFADNPFLVFDDGDEQQDLLLEGFHKRNLSYQSSAQRFTNRRARLQHDLMMLIAHDLAYASTAQGKVEYGITDMGHEFTSSIRSLYARAYRRSARLIVSYLNRLSDTKLQENAKLWLRAEPFLIDIYDTERL